MGFFLGRPLFRLIGVISGVSALIFGGLPRRRLTGISGPWTMGFFLGRPLFRLIWAISGVSTLIFGGLPLGLFGAGSSVAITGFFLGRPGPRFIGAMKMADCGWGDGLLNSNGVVLSLSAFIRRGGPSFSTSQTNVPLLAILWAGRGFPELADLGLMDIARVASRSPRENLSRSCSGVARSREEARTP